MLLKRKKKKPSQDFKLGIIAGGGFLPQRLVENLQKNNMEFFVISIIDNAEDLPPYLKNIPHVHIHIGQIGKAIKHFKQQGIKDLVFAGQTKRPPLSKLKLDAMGMKLFTKVTSAKFLGDNTLLSTILKFFEEQEFTIHGINDILDDFSAQKGAMTKIKPSKKNLIDIALGKKTLTTIGPLDIGQSVVTENGIVLGIEAIEGTDELINRCSTLQSEDSNATLVKMKKPNQDERVDLPTIGITTIENVKKSGFSGIAVEAEKTLIIDKDQVISKANEYKLFLIGI